VAGQVTATRSVSVTRPDRSGTYFYIVAAVTATGGERGLSQ
jgi:hypothetical protein